MKRALSLLLLAACGASQRPGPAPEDELRAIPESRAIEVVRETVRDETELSTAAGWEIDAGGARLPVDVRLGDGRYGVEWVSAQDRLDHGAILPEPAPDGQLRILPGAGDDAAAQILILDARSYRFDPDRERVEHGSRGLAEAEGRLRRDVHDFLVYTGAEAP